MSNKDPSCGVFYRTRTNSRRVNTRGVLSQSALILPLLLCLAAARRSQPLGGSLGTVLVFVGHEYLTGLDAGD